MTHLDDRPLEPAELRLRDAISELIDALTEEQRHECVTLADLDVEVRGCKVKFVTPDVLEVFWAGASIGIVSQSWLNTGEMPDPWPPAWYDTRDAS